MAPASALNEGTSPKVRLADHVGAMALVDDLRHQQNIIDELIDLPRRREEVARMLREHYTRQNIPVLDSLIEAGVRAYFDRRLRFEAPEPSGLGGKFGQAMMKAYITRDQWKFHALGAAALIVAAIAGTQIYGVHQQAQFEKSKEGLIERIKLEAEETVKLDVLLGARALAADENKVFRLDALNAYLKSKRTTFGGLQRAEDLDALVNDFTKRIQNSDDLKTISGDLDRLDAEQGDLNRLAQASQKTLDAISAFANLRAQPDFQAALKKYPRLLEIDLAIQKTIEQSDGESLLGAALGREVDALQKRFNGLPVLDRIAQRSEAVLKTAAESDARAKAMLADAADGVTLAIAGTDPDLAQKKLAWLESVAGYVQAQGELRIVDRAGVKSGIERTWAADGQQDSPWYVVADLVAPGVKSGLERTRTTDGRQDKRWYVVTELVSPGGAVLPVPVTSAETGKTELAKTFAVGISQAAYNAIKEDKLSDGRIDQAKLGNKSVGRFDIDYTNEAIVRAQDNNPGRARMILEW